MKHSESEAMDDAWQPCESGTLSGRAQLSAKTGFARRMRARPLTVGLLLGVILSAVVSGLVNRGDEHQIARAPNVMETNQELTALTCEQVRAALAARCDGPLETSFHRRVENHLVSCERCRTAYEDLQHRGELPADAFLLSRQWHTWNRTLLADISFAATR